MTFLEVKDLHISIDGKGILTGLNLGLNKGEVHAIMGPNGSGKSTLANAIMGHPKYSIDSGDILVAGESILKLSTDSESKKGSLSWLSIPDGDSRSWLQPFFEKCLQHSQQVAW